MATLIGITGGIATGKSLVSQYLIKKGYALVDADQQARQVVERGQPALALIAKHFGSSILHTNGELNRQELGRLIFNNPSQRKELDQMIQPFIFRAIKKQVKDYENANTAFIFLDIPLLFEMGYDSWMDQIWLVQLDNNLQLERLMKRDQLSQKQASKKIKAQLPMDEKMNRADVIIDNNRSIKQTYQQLDQLLEGLHLID